MADADVIGGGGAGGVDDDDSGDDNKTLSPTDRRWLQL